MDINFNGQKVLITGGTRGIGAALADAFESAGAELLLTGTNPDVIKSLNETAGTGRKYFYVDFLKPDSVASFKKCLADLQVDVCVNNAGINRIEPTSRQSSEDYRDVMAVNLDGPVEICRTVIPGMEERGYGKIVNISSIWSVATKAGRGAYCASKTGLLGFTRALSVELATSGILANCVSPGFTLTELTASSLTPEEQHKLSEAIPIKRMAKPAEMAPVVLFVASKLNSYMTGQNLIVDGGFVNV